MLFAKGGLFDRSRDLNWKRLKDVHYFNVMNTPGGDRNALDERFVSLCTTFNVTTPSNQILYNIFGSILRGHLSDFDAELLPISDKLIKITLKLFQVNVSLRFSFCIFLFFFFVCNQCLI